jgi:aryl-alcohol dehydrogenase-like predicted oxidoreductase
MTVDPEAVSGARRTAGESAVAEALGVVTRAQRDLAARETRPLLDPPSPPFRLRPLGETGLAFHPVLLSSAAFPDPGTAAAVLDGYLAAGGNALDVADGDDETLRRLGGLLAVDGRRERLLLSAEIGAASLPAARLPAAVDRLLHLLGVDHVDVLGFAQHERGVPIEETLVAAAALVTAGKVRVLAGGGHGGDRLLEARITAGQRGLPRFEAVRPVYSLVERSGYERGVAPIAVAQRLGVFPRLPVPAALAGSRRGLPRRVVRTLAAVDAVAGERAVAPATVALAWLLTKPQVVAPVVPVRDAAGLAAAVAAAGVHLTRSEATALDRASDD